MNAILEVNLSALADNYRLLASKLASGRCGAAVKANAYGLGVEAVAPALAKAGCRDFFCATLEEAIQLRVASGEWRVGKRIPRIYVINGLAKGEEKDCLRYNLIPVLNTPEQIERWSKTLATDHSPLATSALHVDTGMNRLGLSEKELRRLDASQVKKARVGLVMSHLACADSPKHPLNKQQLQRFRAALAHLPKLPASLANSAGIYFGKDYHFDLARPGCALYGINPTPDKKNPMRAVATLSAPILQLREITKRESIGYDATYFAKPGDRIATLGIGYADGFFRSLSNTAHGFIGKVKVPLVGRVSMDLVMMDVTHVPPALLAKNPRIEFIGPQQDVDAFAKVAGTIGYEVFTRLGRRVQRVYK